MKWVFDGTVVDDDALPRYSPLAVPQVPLVPLTCDGCVWDGDECWCANILAPGVEHRPGCWTPPPEDNISESHALPLSHRPPVDLSKRRRDVERVTLPVPEPEPIDWQGGDVTHPTINSEAAKYVKGIMWGILGGTEKCDPPNIELYEEICGIFDNMTLSEKVKLPAPEPQRPIDWDADMLEFIDRAWARGVQDISDYIEEHGLFIVCGGVFPPKE